MEQIVNLKVNVVNYDTENREMVIPNEVIGSVKIPLVSSGGSRSYPNIPIIQDVFLSEETQGEVFLDEFKFYEFDYYYAIIMYSDCNGVQYYFFNRDNIYDFSYKNQDCAEIDYVLQPIEYEEVMKLKAITLGE